MNFELYNATMFSELSHYNILALTH